jgi:hypothetical protein
LKLAIPQTAERLRAVNDLYRNNFERLISEALDSNKHLTAFDAHNAASSLAHKLKHYRLMLKDDDFCRWAANVLEATIFIHALIAETERFVYKAIHNVLANCDGLGVDYCTADEIASDVWMWALTHIDELRKPGTAKLTTRMSDRARWQARAWKTQQLRDKAKYASLEDAETAQTVELNGGRQTSPVTVEY